MDSVIIIIIKVHRNGQWSTVSDVDLLNITFRNYNATGEQSVIALMDVHLFL